MIRTVWLRVGFIIVVVIIGGYVWYVYSPGLGDIPLVRSGDRTKITVTEGGGSWEVRAKMPTKRTEVSSAVLKEKIFVVGGLSGTSRTLATVEVYDPVADRWSRVADIPEPRHHAAVVAVGSKLYVIGGYDGIRFTPQSDVFVFDPATELWSRDISLPDPRGAHGAAVIDGAIYVVGGVTDGGVSADLLRWRPGEVQWQQLAAMPTSREHLAVASIGNELLVAGGRQGSPANNLATLEIFEVELDAWRSGPDVPTARGGVTGVATDTLFIISGGESTTKTFDEVEAYDLTIQAWHSLPPLPTARHGLASGVVDTVLYVIGGGRRPGLSVSGMNESLQLP